MGELHAAPGARTPRDGTASASPEHTPVLVERCLELLAPALDGDHAVHLDATLGLGGHAEAVLRRFPQVRVVGLDRDPLALAQATQRLQPFGDRVNLVHVVYDHISDVLHEFGLNALNGVLFDLGVSSMQLDQAERGFAYAQDAPLDMRMDPTVGITAEDVVNTYPPAELARVLRVYGEERFATRIANAIVRQRARARITSSAQLVELVRQAIPAPARRTGGNPAKRTFQALRIEVNGELSALEAALPQALDGLAIGGRIVVLSYHSLEDRIVKRALVERARSTAPVDLPVEVPGTSPTLRLLTRGAQQPSEAETTQNPRAASARLRAAERINPAARGGDGPVMRQPARRGKPSRRQRADTTWQPSGTAGAEPDDTTPGAVGPSTTDMSGPMGTDRPRRGGTSDADRGEGR